MKKLFQNPVKVFILMTLFIAVPLCIFPLNLFQGEVILENGISEQVVKAPLSLSYFFGLGYSEEDMIGIKDYYLLPEGYLLAFLFIVGIPALAAYRVYLGKKRAKKH
jgi:hypothetical protein